MTTMTVVVINPLRTCVKFFFGRKVPARTREDSYEMVSLLSLVSVSGSSSSFAMAAFAYSVDDVLGGYVLAHGFFCRDAFGIYAFYILETGFE